MSSQPEQNYRVVARRFRPREFGEVVGQESVLRSLRGALETDRLPHALLFSGSRGVGKTTLARIVARALNCEVGVGASPCGECHACKSILAGNNPDVVEIDAASHNLVDDIRELRDRVGFASMGSRYKVYILDEVHMLTRNAFNAFLKTLEEPPAKVVFILATTELHKVPETIRSRCQVHLFRRIGDDDIVTRLGTICGYEKVDIDVAVLEEIAASSRGGMRDAETALERVLPIAASMPGGKLDLETYRRLVHRVGLDRVVELVAALVAGDAAAGLHFAAAVAEGGVDEREALGEVVEVLRAMLLLSVDGSESGLVVHSGAMRARLVELAGATDRDRIDAMIQAGLNGRERIRRLDDRRLVLEISLLRMAEAGCVPSLTELVEQVRSGAPIDAVGGGVTVVASGSSAAPGGSSAAPGAGFSAGAGPAGGAPVSRGGLKAALHAALAQRKPMLQSTVDACTFEGPNSDGVIEVRLTTPRKMHSDRLKSTEVCGLLGELLTEITGRPVRLQVAGDAEAGGERRSARPPGAAVDRIAKKFDGKFLDTD